jgi:hypothetical protein
MPGRLPGSAKTGGRRAGTPNRDTKARREDLLSRIEMIELEMDLPPGTLHPVEGLARIAGNPKTPLDVKVDCLKSIAPYCIPKLATVTVKGDEDNPIVVEHVNIDRFMLDPQLVAAAQRVALAMEDADMLEEPETKLIEMRNESTVS